MSALQRPRNSQNNGFLRRTGSAESKDGEIGRQGDGHGFLRRTKCIKGKAILGLLIREFVGTKAVYFLSNYHDPREQCL